MVAHTGLEPVISALRGQRVNQLHQCAAVRLWDYRGRTILVASCLSFGYLRKTQECAQLIRELIALPGLLLAMPGQVAGHTMSDHLSSDAQSRSYHPVHAMNR